MFLKSRNISSGQCIQADLRPHHCAAAVAPTAVPVQTPARLGTLKPYYLGTWALRASVANAQQLSTSRVR